MDKKGEISLYRARLDKSLASPELTDHETLKGLVKDSNKEYRVMYRPGPKGSPFHSLLVEGYVDGPVDACLCIGWESALYRKCVKKLVKKGPRWSQVIMPPFKISACKCLKRIRIGEQISLVRVKVWPLQAREAVIHYVLFEYLKEGIIIVLMNTVPDLETIDVNTHGFTKDGIPAAQDLVRADLVGGFALQKVSSTRSYFRTIAAADLKFDFIPPTLINFISRQLIGSGFELYRKAVTTLYKDDEDYVQALADPFYARLREGIYASDTNLPRHDHSTNGMKNNTRDMELNVDEDNVDEIEGYSQAADKGVEKRNQILQKTVSCIGMQLMFRSKVPRENGRAVEQTSHDSMKWISSKDHISSSQDLDVTRMPHGSNEEVIEKRATDASDFLDMLRSASLKESREEFRVLYREGPPGTPMHTLFVEGYVDGPIESCLCIAWETTLYDKWFPNLSFPNFKVTISKKLQKIQFGEQISLMRVKITWPLSARESILHYFMFEYLKEGLVIVLLNTISDSENLDVATHGFTRDGIPEPNGVVRMDLVGGFAMQRINSERSYVCLIGNIDFKLDMMPPSLINFVARQLIGGGYKLYQKAVVTTSKRDEAYVKAMKDPMYTRLRDIFCEKPLDIKQLEDVPSSMNGSFVDAMNVMVEDLADSGSDSDDEPKFLSRYGSFPICPDLKLAFASLERASSTVTRYGVNVLSRSFSRSVVVNKDGPMEDKTPELETTVSKNADAEVSESLMANAPAPIKCPSCNYISWGESESARGGESRGVMSDPGIEGIDYEKKKKKKKGRKHWKRRYLASCFGY
ncbi:hypothetical protein LINPERHAP2_LOCUS13980 [Linum perenne]